MLAPTLWDLRSQMEAQLRHLDKVQKWTNELSTLSGPRHFIRQNEIVESLSEILGLGDLIHDIAANAIAIAKQETIGTLARDRRRRQDRRSTTR